ncbi:hypothetical protein SGRIM128S_05738 [Streptomyces griseomycini]
MSSCVSGRSTRPPQRSGCSSAATRPRPHSADCPNPPTASSATADTAPAVTHHNGARTPASPSARNNPTVAAAPVFASARPSSETTPRSSGSPVSRSVQSAVSGSTPSTCVSAPARSSAARVHSARPSPAGATTSQAPSNERGPTGTGRQTTWYRQSSTVDRSRCSLRHADSLGSTALSGSSDDTPNVPARSAASPSSTTSQNRASTGDIRPPPSAVVGASSQYRSRWKAYVGRSTRRASRLAKNASQSTVTPRACSAATVVTRAVSSGRSPRNAGRKTASETLSRPRADSVPPGPISRNTSTPCSRSATTASWKRTDSRTCRTQYSGEANSSALTCAPVSVDTIGTTGSPNSTSSSTARKSSSIGSISGEWNAWLTFRRDTFRPAARHRSATASTSATAPEITTDDGPLTAATPTVSDRSGATSASDAWSATIAPPDGSACISVPRAETTLAASASDHTPATWAAASSPIECPASTSGRMPHDSSSRKSATSTANNAGCVTPVSLNASASSPNNTPRTAGSNALSVSSSASANTGKRSASSRPIPSRCDP